MIWIAWLAIVAIAFAVGVGIGIILCQVPTRRPQKNRDRGGFGV